MKTLILFLFLCICMSAFGQTGESAPDLADLEKSTENRLLTEESFPKMIDRSKLKKIKKSSDQDILITQENELTGIILEDYKVSSDDSRASLLYHVNFDLFNAGGLSNFEVNYANKYEFGWMEYFVMRSTALFSEVAQYSSDALLNISELSLEDASVSILSLGTGMSFRTHYIQDALNSSSWFETVGANIGYYSMSESLSATKFSGFGIKVDAGMHRRTSKNIHMGLKMSYNLASLKRSAQSEDESSSARSLTLRWISLGFDIGYYF